MTYVVPPKVGCVCFLKDYRPSVGKLDPRALKCIFVGYSGKQKGYKCWCPSERRMFVSMDVVFREQESFYGESTDLSDVFPDLVTNNISDADCETGGDRDKDEENNGTTSTKLIIGAIPIGDEIEQEIPNEASRWPKPNEEREIQVYKRRHKIEEQHMQGEEITSSGHEPEAQEEPAIDSSSSLQIPQLSASNNNTSPHYTDLNVPIAQRKQPRLTVGKLPSKFTPYNVSNYLSYTTVETSYKSSIATLDVAEPIPYNW
jgi:hypothetical protein